jgi:hypothetical protein
MSEENNDAAPTAPVGEVKPEQGESPRTSTFSRDSPSCLKVRELIWDDFGGCSIDEHQGEPLEPSFSFLSGKEEAGGDKRQAFREEEDD